MSVTLLRQKVKDETVDEAEPAVRDLFATLERVPSATRRREWRAARRS